MSFINKTGVHLDAIVETWPVAGQLSVLSLYLWTLFLCILYPSRIFPDIECLSRQYLFCERNKASLQLHSRMAARLRREMFLVLNWSERQVGN